MKGKTEIGLQTLEDALVLKDSDELRPSFLSGSTLKNGEGPAVRALAVACIGMRKHVHFVISSMNRSSLPLVNWENLIH